MKNTTSTVMIDHIVAVEPYFDRPEQCRLRLTGGEAVSPMRSPASLLELIGDYSPFIMLEILIARFYSGYTAFQASNHHTH